MNEKHSAFVTIDGINKVMGLYEQLILEFHYQRMAVVFQHDGNNFGERIVYIENC